MAEIAIKVPDPGIESKKIWVAKWHLRDGAPVSLGEVFCTLETSKIVSELEAEISGTIHHVVKEQAVVKVGDQIAVLRHDGDTKLEISLSDNDLSKVDHHRGAETRSGFLTRLAKQGLEELS